MSADVSFSRVKDIGVFRINEAIELYLVEKLRSYLVDTIEKYGMKKIIIRMDNVPFIDSSGLGAFINLKYLFKDRVRFRFCEVRPNVRAVFQYSNLLSQFDIDDNLEGSIEALGNVGG